MYCILSKQSLVTLLIISAEILTCFYSTDLFAESGYPSVGFSMGIDFSSMKQGKQHDRKIKDHLEYSFLGLDASNNIKNKLIFKHSNSREIDMNGMLFAFPWTFHLYPHWNILLSPIFGLAFVDVNYTNDYASYTDKDYGNHTYFQLGGRGEVIYRNRGYGVSVGVEYLNSLRSGGFDGVNIILSWLIVPKLLEPKSF
ncbi:MAG: hypothetical protein HQK53_11555 [Oligoflexia bacterium]|nr:hypothetical protein [Oligoflexia bacterium]